MLLVFVAQTSPVFHATGKVQLAQPAIIGISKRSRATITRNVEKSTSLYNPKGQWGTINHPSSGTIRMQKHNIISCL